MKPLNVRMKIYCAGTCEPEPSYTTCPATARYLIIDEGNYHIFPVCKIAGHKVGLQFSETCCECLTCTCSCHVGGKP